MLQLLRFYVYNPSFYYYVIKNVIVGLKKTFWKKGL